MKIMKISFVVMITLLVIVLGFNSAAADCPGDITITTPKDGEIVSGDAYEIKWSDPQCNSGEEIKLYYCYKTSSDICRFIDNVDANNKVYPWDTTSMEETKEYWLEAKIGGDLIYYKSDNMFEVDNSAPDRVTMTLVEGPRPDRWESGKSNNPNVTFHWSPPNDDGPGEIANYSVQCFGGQGTETLGPDAREYTCTFDDGTNNKFLISATDTVGNRGSGTYYQDYWIDTTLPTFDLDGTFAADHVDGDIYMMVDDHIRFFVDDVTDGEGSGVKRVKYYIGGQQMWPGAQDQYVTADPYVARDPTDPAEAPEDYEYVTGPLPSDMNERAYVVSFRLYDWAGNTEIYAFNQIILDRTAPEIVSVKYTDDNDEGTSDSNGAGRIVMDGDTMTVTAKFSDSSGIAEATPKITIDCPNNDSNGNIAKTAMTMDTNTIWTYDYVVGAWGLNEDCNVIIEVDDRAGNIFEQEFLNAFSHDNIPPVVSINASPGYLNADSNTVYAGFDIDDVSDYILGVTLQDHEEIGVHSGDWHNSMLTNTNTGTEDGGDGSCGDLDGTFEHCFSRLLEGNEGQETRVRVFASDYGGNLGSIYAPEVHTDFVPPTTPNIDLQNRQVYHTTRLSSTVIAPAVGSADIDPDNFWTYERKTNTDPWQLTDETELNGFDFALIPNYLNTLCIRGVDEATNRGEADCVKVASDSVAPEQVDDLEIFDAIAPNTVTLTWSDVNDGIETPGDYASGIYYYRIYAWKFSDHGRCFDNITEPGVIELDYAVGVHEDKSVDITNLDVGDELHEGREYCFAVAAYDNAGNYPIGAQTEIGVPYPNEQVELIDDWNFVSTPVILANSSMDAVFKDIKDDVIIVWYYDASGDGEWLSWTPNGGEDNTLTNFDHGKGYLIDMRNERTLELAGRYSGMLGGGEMLPEYPVYESWNMVGYTKSGPDTTSSVDNYFVSLMWDPITVLTHYPENGLVGVENMDIGHGYWLNVDTNGDFAPGYDPLV
jgi:hypothetical protein